MEKKNKKNIVVASAILLLITLALLGLTYAYYRTQVIGNENPTTISVKGKNVQVKYDDGNASVTATEIEPGWTNDGVYDSSKTPKTFTVTNTSSEDYSYNLIFDEINNDFRTGDWTFELTYPDGVKTGVVSNGTSQKVLAGYVIPAGTTQEFSLVVKYLDLVDVDQSDDMGKNFKLRVNIQEPTDFDNLTTTEGSLLAALKNDNVVSEPLTKIGSKASLDNEAVLASVSYNATETTPQEAYYYYRGNVQNNYVNFAGMCFRIVHIKNNESVKLILEDKDNECQNSTTNTNVYSQTHYGFLAMNASSPNNVYADYFYTYDARDAAGTTNYSETSRQSSMIKMAYDFENVLAEKLKGSEVINRTDAESYLGQYLNTANLCVDPAYDSSGNMVPISNNIYTYYKDLDRTAAFDFYSYRVILYINNASTQYPASLQCNQNFVVNQYNDGNDSASSIFDEGSIMYASTLSASDVLFAGGANRQTSNYYLKTSYQYYTTSPFRFTGTTDFVYFVDVNGEVSTIRPNQKRYYRPTINLKANTSIVSGNGTKSSPYVVG